MIQDKETYQRRLNLLFERMAKSSDAMICSQAMSVLIERHSQCGEYRLAEERIKQLPTSLHCINTLNCQTLRLRITIVTCFPQ